MPDEITHTYFRIVEQHDGRYICIAIFGKNSYSTRKGDTIVPYENEVRSLTTIFGEIAEFVCDSGLMYDHNTIIEFVRHPA